MIDLSQLTPFIRPLIVALITVGGLWALAWLSRWIGKNGSGEGTGTAIVFIVGMGSFIILLTNVIILVTSVQ